MLIRKKGYKVENQWINYNGEQIYVPTKIENEFKKAFINHNIRFTEDKVIYEKSYTEYNYGYDTYSSALFSAKRNCLNWGNDIKKQIETYKNKIKDLEKTLLLNNIHQDKLNNEKFDEENIIKNESYFEYKEE